eukprot:COSAG01_NODE_10694_length_2103_cov_2.049955_1_plen_221_part_00
MEQVPLVRTRSHRLLPRAARITASAAGAAAVASFLAAVLAEIYLCHVCSCQEILRRNGRGQPPAPPAPGYTLTVAQCIDGGSPKQAWHVRPSDGSIRGGCTGDGGGGGGDGGDSCSCLTLAAADAVPGSSPPTIPNASPLTLTPCGSPLRQSQKWLTALGQARVSAANDTSNHVHGTGKWIQWRGPHPSSSPCVELNMASVHRGDKYRLRDISIRTGIQN